MVESNKEAPHPTLGDDNIAAERDKGSFLLSVSSDYVPEKDHTHKHIWVL